LQHPIIGSARRHEDAALIPRYLIGIDEAGRGPWSGSVFAAAVVLNPNTPIAGLNDSKKLTASKRDALAVLIKTHALAWGVGSASASEVDEVNILQATFLAMRRAIDALPLAVRNHGHAWVDGNRDPLLGMPTTTLVKGDALVPAISAASILAKVARDAESHNMHLRYPHFGFDSHKGYGTALHSANLATYGALPEHRRSFAPVARWYAQHTA
jgi:ribonuclease HII